MEKLPVPSTNSAGGLCSGVEVLVRVAASLELFLPDLVKSSLWSLGSLRMVLPSVVKRPLRPAMIVHT